MPQKLVDQLGVTPPEGITLKHLAPTIGTEVTGIDLRKALKPNEVQFLRSLWLTRKVLFFRDQDLTHEQHVRFGRYFGELQTYPTDAIKGHPEFLVFERGQETSQRENFWHVDTSMAPRPVAGCIALLRTCPEIGGDTLFADMEAAYEGLSPWMKGAIAPLRAVHRFDTNVRRYYPSFTQELVNDVSAEFPPISLPLVNRHPETGAKILYACDVWTPKILGLPEDESAMLLKFLCDRASRPEYQCRFQWEKNSIAFWDNRSTQHYASFDYEGQNRRMERVSVRGERDWDEVQREPV